MHNLNSHTAINSVCYILMRAHAFSPLFSAGTWGRGCERMRLGMESLF